MGWFFDDLYSALERQFTNDKERKAKELASATADPQIAARISAYRQRHPHLTPGVVLSAAQAGLPVDDPAIDRLAQQEAKRKVSKNKGWFSIGDRPIGMNPLEYIGRSWDEVEAAAKTAIRVPFTAFQSGGEFLQATARETLKDPLGPIKTGARLVAPVGPIGTALGFSADKKAIQQTTGFIAAERVINNSEGGAGIGDGYLPRGAAVDEQRRRARESYFIEYADHPLWHQPGDKRVSEPHAGTLGRLAFKDVVQPGSRPYWLLSGIVDAGFQIVADPFVAAGKVVKGVRVAAKAFDAVDAGKASKTALGLVDGIRPTIHPPTTQNWLTLSKPGQKFTNWAAETNDPYQVWRKLGGEKGNITPDLAVRIADTRSIDDVLTTLGNELGTGLRTKPITSSRQPIGGYLGEVKSSIYENRLFNKMPHKAVRVDDPEAVANQIVRLGRGGELDETSIGQLFNQAARAATPEDRVNVLREAEVRIAKSMAEKFHGPISGRDINYSRLRGVFERNEAAMQQVIKSQIANKTGVKSATIDGIDVPLSSVHLEGEYLDQIYQLPDPREMRRMLNQYGRLLNNPVLDLPISALDHIQNVWRGAAILRPALTLRTVGEEQAWMAGAGYSSLFTHPFSLIAWATGRKGSVEGLFDAADELSAFSKSQAKSELWRTRIIGSQHRIVPFTDPEFTKAWSNDIWKLRDDDVARRLASGSDITSVKAWLRSDEAQPYRRLNNVTDDLVDGYVENLSNTLKGKTYGDQSLLDAISTGIYNNRPIFAKSDQGAITLDQGFRNHLKSLVDKDISPDHTIGDLPTKRPHPREFYSRATDMMFDTLLTRPHNYLSASPVFKQAFWKRIEEGIFQASPETQARMIELAEEANMGAAYIKGLRARAKSGSGNLSEDEYLLWAKAQALEEKKRVITDLSDKNQLLDAMRLTVVFSEAWKQSLTTWARIISENPAVLPRASMIVQGGRGSGFFYTDEQTGEEMMAYPGAGFLTGKLNQALGGADVGFPLQARIESLTMFGANPLLPSFGPIAQVAAGKLLPETPDNAALRQMIIPYDSDPVRLPGWLDKVWTAAFTSPDKNVAYGNLVWDVTRYLKSTGEYDIDTYAGQQAIEDKARKTAKFMLLFRGLAQSSLPAAPSYQDLAKDQDGHTTLAFTLTKRYQELLEEDRDKRTQEATARFITEFGMDNLLYMQSASQGGEVFTKSGLDWVKRNPDIVSRYPEVYGLLAPSEGGLDLKAYMALFENGTRRPIPPKEALSLANHRAAKMILRSAQAQLPDPAKRNAAQRLWLDDLKERLKDKFPGFDPEYQGTDIPKKIDQLSKAVADPMLSRLPQTAAIRTYLAAREAVNQQANQANILGWQTAKKLKPQRQWLRQVASQLISQSPQFRQVYDELFDNEMTADD